MAQVLSIFNFLKEYNELSNPVITELVNQKWSLNISDLPRINEIKSVFTGEDVNGLSILEVKKPILEPCPPPEDFLLDWLERDWKKLSTEEVSIKEMIVREIIGEGSNKSYEEERFDFSVERIEAYETWTLQRKQWREAEVPKEKGLTLYNNLFKLYSDMKKEAESVELILGDGILVWQKEAIRINHPVLLQKVYLEFDPLTPAFTIKCEEIKTDIYTSLLRIIPSINQKMLSDLIQDVEANNYSIADFNNTFALYKRMIHVIDRDGRFTEERVPIFLEAHMFSCPVLFLRKRTLGYSMFIDSIIDEINQKGEELLPEFFTIMAGKHKETNHIEVIEDNWNHSGIDQDILLTLPANNEQLKIIKYLDKYGAVLVQGPPGTGKTHTIANLIGHLLSQGDSVLVTSHTEKALTVLKDKVYKDQYSKDLNLQSLCISLLSSRSQKKEMDEAINEIAEKGTTLNLHEGKKRIEHLVVERESLIHASKERSGELLQIRSLEYKDIVYDNQTIRPIEAAQFIKSGVGSFDYIKSITGNDTIGLPLSIADLKFLFETNDTITVADEAVLNHSVPDFMHLWKPQDFEDKKILFEQLQRDLRQYTLPSVFEENVAESAVNDLMTQCLRIRSEIQNFEALKHTIINKSITNSVYSKLWQDVIREFDQLMESYEKVCEIRLEEEFDISKALMDEDPLSILQEIIGSGKEVPITFLTRVSKPKWKKIKECITNNGKVIENRKDFILAYDLISYEFSKNKVLKKVKKLLSEDSFDTTVIEENFELVLANYRNEIISALSWYEEQWTPIFNQYNTQLCNSFKFENHLNVNAPLSSILDFIDNIILPNLTFAVSKFRYDKVQAEWNSFFEYVSEYQGSNTLVDKLISSVELKDSSSYKSSYLTLAAILSKKETFVKRKALLRELQEIAPGWAQAIEAREGIHGFDVLPENIEQAWKWCQLSNQLARIDAYDPNKIQKELELLNNRLLVNARKLAYEKAWFEIIRNRTTVQAQAIEGWRTTIRQIGKGTGKSAPMLMKKARELMPLCQSAIPVWIMPLNRVVENFDPRNNKFDVVIIDEASQSDILALSALYLGKRIIIVGDEEQVSPDSVGIKKDEIDALIQQYLQGIPNNHLFNAQTSLYDMAKSSGFKPLMLTEHFRCLPEIIEFSNQLSYNGRIKPLREGAKVKTKPPVIEYRVAGGCKNHNKVNEVEAEHIASLVCACVEMEEYKGKSFGIISLLGIEQSYEIDRLLQTYLDPVDYESRKIQCGTPPQFQGDERDVIFLSVVEGPSEKGGPVRLLSEDGRNDLTRKRYNVAASRAKDQMWVIHSLNPEIDLKPDDIRLRLIKHAINPNSQEEEQLLLSVAESPFETEVMTILLNKGYKVNPQMKVGAYRIDMVIEDGDKRIALECDGEKWHTQDDLPNDLKRQAILERLGWNFIRIRGSAFYRDQDTTMHEVFSQLDSHGIRPNYACNIDFETNKDEELIVRVKRRANEICQSWHRVDGEDLDGKKSKKEEPSGKDTFYVDPKAPPIKTQEKTVAMLVGDYPNNYLTGSVATNKINKGKGDRPLYDFRNHIDNGSASATKAKKDANRLESNCPRQNNPEAARNNHKPLFDFRQKNHQ
ncbi:AAA domain-containing protein [Desulfosporosinus sp.]|uniref:AAA domain-containing protein n=1 Tax=Desulfosporosinus sp. TaxID=157907 RepID=UPI0025C40D2A|nr:AAA domain-containing protein [Desulfosporosinus sp.]MBC2726105.1 AAA family ATPase [Desulfosporosinus sp.]